jgi:hypothetical protein
MPGLRGISDKEDFVTPDLYSDKSGATGKLSGDLFIEAEINHRDTNRSGGIAGFGTAGLSIWFGENGDRGLSHASSRFQPLSGRIRRFTHFYSSLFVPVIQVCVGLAGRICGKALVQLTPCGKS